MHIEPDPAHPRGGYALISLNPGDVADPAVSLTIRNSFNDKYLGAAGWQSDKAFFGPYDVQVKGDQAQFIVGSEIVNQIEEYTMLMIGIGDREYEVSWPDDVMQGPPAATIGGVSASPHKASAGTGPTLVGKAKPEPEPEPVDPAPKEDPPVVVSDPIPEPRVSETSDPARGGNPWV